jgi:hypothetical protein
MWWEIEFKEGNKSEAYNSNTSLKNLPYLEEVNISDGHKFHTNKIIAHLIVEGKKIFTVDMAKGTLTGASGTEMKCPNTTRLILYKRRTATDQKDGDTQYIFGIGNEKGETHVVTHTLQSG